MKLYDSIIEKELITNGWSKDQKYCVTTANGTKYLLRVAPFSEYTTRKSLYSILVKAAELGVPMCTPIEFGTCDDGVYYLQSWINGKDLQAVLPTLSNTEQYTLGIKAGEILQRIHMISAPKIQREWARYYDYKTEMCIKEYQACGLRFNGDDHILSYIDQNRCLLRDRPQCFHHGDYSMRNMMLENDELKCIDFERYYFGDPYYEFFYVMLDADKNPYFTTGQFYGYFNGEPPIEFFKLYAFYIVTGLLSAIYEATLHGQDEIENMLRQSQDVLGWFDNMRNPIPTWYINDFTT